jgi:hypothetical protein
MAETLGAGRLGLAAGDGARPVHPIEARQTISATLTAATLTMRLIAIESS